jgi:hypothetical protein
MRGDLVKGIVVGAVVAAVVSTAAVAVAGTGIGGVFNLGQTNAVNAGSTLQGNATGPNLQIVQKGGGAALGLVVQTGKAPITVSAGAGKVRNLDADKLDGLDSTAFVSGQIFTGHVPIPLNSPTNVVSVPHLGMMSAVWNGSEIDFNLTNSTPGDVDMTWIKQSADGQPIHNGSNILFNIGEVTNDTAVVQIAWGSGTTAHFVHLTISWYIQSPGPRVLVFGYAH